MGAVTVGYKLPLKLALGVRETVAGHRPGALRGGGGGGTSPPSNASLPAGQFKGGEGGEGECSTDVSDSRLRARAVSFESEDAGSGMGERQD